MSVGKASIRRAANAETKKAVINPIDSEEIQVVFLKDKKEEEKGRMNEPVRLTEELPAYLL